jgi:PAS domain S-box-containing protein
VSSTPFLRGQAFDPGSEPETRADQFPQPVPIVESSDDWAQLHKISTLLIPEGNLDSLYNHILDAATSLMSSDMASMQLLDPERNRLRLLASKGFHPQSASFWEWVYLDSGSTCGLALFSGCRVVVADVETCDFMAGTTDLDEYRRSNIRAVQSTPLLSRSGQLLGMISTHWHEPHKPAERALQRLDVLARQTADLIERSRTEVAGSERAERLASLLTLSYEPMLVWQLNGPIEFWNTGAERLYGFAPEEAVGRSSHALLQTKFPVEFTELISQLQNERYWSGELRHICKDGREVIVESRQQLLDDDVILEVNRDVTKVKALEAGQTELARELSAAAAKFEAIFNQSSIFAGIMDLRGYLREANNLSLEQCGYTREEVLDRPFWDTPWWRGSDEMKARIRFATEQAALGHIFREELQYWVADGSERIVDFAMHPIRDRSGTVAFLHPTGIDITERKRAEAALRESEQRFRWLASVVESSDEAIVSKNLDGVITSWNKGAERVFGYTAEEAIGKPITIVIPHDRYDEERMILTRIRRGERIDHFETVRQRKHGSFINVSLTVSPVKDADGKIVGASKIARDITEQKRIQEQIATLAREAEHRSKNLLANVQATVNLSRSDTIEGLKQAIEGRIRALSNVHSLFVATRWIGAEMSTIAAQELAPYSEAGDKRVRIDGPQTLLEPNAAQTVAMILHELATNAAKYGSLSTNNGQVDLKWEQQSDGRLQLRWAETGGPKVQEPTCVGFGGRIIEQMIAQLKGKSSFDWRPEGLFCEITLRP